MPFGTASGRLRKMILFELLKRHDENVCYRCALKIEKLEDLSIEHKQPWEGRSVELFWDLSNIAFSHLRCNYGDRNRKKTQCHKGHTFISGNFVFEKGKRRCLVCRRIRNRTTQSTPEYNELRRIRRRKKMEM